MIRPYDLEAQQRQVAAHLCRAHAAQMGTTQLWLSGLANPGRLDQLLTSSFGSPCQVRAILQRCGQALGVKQVLDAHGAQGRQ